MVRTVMKHEFLRTRMVLAGHLAVTAAVIAAIAALAATGWSSVSTVAFPAGIAVLASFLVGVLVYLAIDYWRSSYGRTGYFTQTLPIKGSILYRAKLCYAVLAYLTILLAAIPLALLLYLGATQGDTTGLRYAWQRIQTDLPWWGWLAIITMTLLTVVEYVAQAFFAASIGSESRFRALGAAGPVVVWLGSYLVAQALLVVSMLMVPLAVVPDGAGRWTIQSGNPLDLLAADTSNAMPLGIIVGMLVFLALVVWRTVRSWNSKVSLA